MSDKSDHTVQRYRQFVKASYSHAIVMTLRRRSAVLGAAVALTPVLIPLALAFFSDSAYAADGSQVFERMVEGLYLIAISPLLSLFFGLHSSIFRF